MKVRDGFGSCGDFLLDKSVQEVYTWRSISVCISSDEDADFIDVSLENMPGTTCRRVASRTVQYLDSPVAGHRGEEQSAIIRT